MTQYETPYRGRMILPSLLKMGAMGQKCFCEQEWKRISFFIDQLQKYHWRIWIIFKQSGWLYLFTSNL